MSKKISQFIDTLVCRVYVVSRASKALIQYSIVSYKFHHLCNIAREKERIIYDFFVILENNECKFFENLYNAHFSVKL